MAQLKIFFDGGYEFEQDVLTLKYVNFCLVWTMVPLDGM